MFIVGDSDVLVTDGVINFTTHTTHHRSPASCMAKLLIIKELLRRMYFIAYVVNQLMYL